MSEISAMWMTNELNGRRPKDVPTWNERANEAINKRDCFEKPSWVCNPHAGQQEYTISHDCHWIGIWHLASGTCHFHRIPSAREAAGKQAPEIIKELDVYNRLCRRRRACRRQALWGAIYKRFCFHCFLMGCHVCGSILLSSFALLHFSFVAFSFLSDFFFLFFPIFFSSIFQHCFSCLLSSTWIRPHSQSYRSAPKCVLTEYYSVALSLF